MIKKISMFMAILFLIGPALMLFAIPVEAAEPSTRTVKITDKYLTDHW